MANLAHVPAGKEVVTHDLLKDLVHRRNGQRLHKSRFKPSDIEWVITIGNTRAGLIDQSLAERIAYWPKGAQAHKHSGPCASGG